jgi:hypothetical protein
MRLKLTNREKLHIMDEALSHIKKVEADPDVVIANVDNYDAWFAYTDISNLLFTYKQGKVKLYDE